MVGIRIEAIQRRLLGEKDLTYTKAREIAISMKIALNERCNVNSEMVMTIEVRITPLCHV